ncbi:Holliday junction resolvase [Candidatus Woesearchaeota archaeon]|jgi:holliday junction resolvase Hjr|nr:Holliday junction resolvase [Candidatus Woesearchaeota archaeon]MBT4387331.1 Holliday junction resolvase [Candidatus Woesearchaeota archaeon]MBT4595470.1 Holliday junction resolvase [Candidatus Woesearchaeota archaeon]MBT5740839.1 Holliday junction resolvase [Candidatus Woesearchaeota archaeon]MBT6506101.1 Holliday junction resolvase [Candidatus Woesearchaeota archaeon]
MINTKSKGSKAERELIHLFWKNNWAALRSAGSGSTKYPSPDILASNNIRKIAIEAKSVKNNYIYINKKQIFELIEFSRMFGCEYYIGAKFEKKGWYFLSIDDLKETEKSFCVNFKEHKEAGFSFNELIGNW